MILQALNDWNVWWHTPSLLDELTGHKRQVTEELLNLIELREIKLLIGVRRSGKSTIFYQIIDSLLKDGVDASHIALINFEDEILSRHSLQEIVNVYREHICAEKEIYLFLDEVHRCPAWELFVRKAYDTKSVKQIFITDSSSKLSSGESATLFTGRNVKLEITPLSFREFLLWHNVSVDSKRMSQLDISNIKRLLNQYLLFGGFPEVSLKKEHFKKMLLKEYFYDIFYRDIIERFQIHVKKAEDLALFLLSNIAHLFSVRKYSREKNISLQSIEKYASCFEQVFFLYFMTKFDYSLKSQQLSQNKVYVVDSGISNMVGFLFSENRGSLFENTVFMELKRRGQKTFQEIYYWKNKQCYEVDFLVKEGLKVTQLIQVCINPHTEATVKREVRALKDAMSHFNIKTSLIITESDEFEEIVDEGIIKYVPLWKWLISEK